MEIIVPSAISGTLAGKRFAIVGFEREAAEKIIAICESVNAFGRVVAPPDPSVALMQLAPYDICVIRATREPAGALIAAADLIARSGKAVVLIGTRDEVMGQMLTLRAAAHDFLVEPWEPGDLLMRSFRVLVRAGDRVAAASGADGGASVIVADDDPTVRTMVSTILRNYHIKCEVAGDGAAALEMVQSIMPHAMVLDINMPRMDGFEVLAALKANPATRAIRVLMLSGRQHETDVMRGFSLGAEDYVSKPFSPMELVARVRRTLRQTF
ncbi:MAG: response regulator [Candidatus Binataceae bacterium]|nr:response regulator [Candidatus Binataceae bacterium]